MDNKKAIKQKVTDIINYSYERYLEERLNPHGIDFKSILEDMLKRLEQVKNEIADTDMVLENIRSIVDESITNIEDGRILYFILSHTTTLDPSDVIQNEVFEIHTTNVFEACFISFMASFNTLYESSFVHSLDLKLIRMDNTKQPGEIIKEYDGKEYSILYEIYHIHLESRTIEIIPTVKVAEMLDGEWVITYKEFIYFDDTGIKCPYEEV